MSVNANRKTNADPPAVNSISVWYECRRVVIHETLQNQHTIAPSGLVVIHSSLLQI
jgi:hypothetical protein